MHLLGHVGQVEIHREGANQLGGHIQVDAGQEGGQLLRDALVVGRLAELPRQAPHLFDQVEQVLAVLADQGPAQLVAEAADVGAQLGVDAGRVIGEVLVVGHVSGAGCAASA